MKKLLKNLAEFTPELFNDHYRNLIVIAVPSSREYEILHVLNFISDCQGAIEKVKEALEKQPEETHCPLCEAKEKTIQINQQIISHMEERLQLKDDIITSLKKSEDEALKALNSITGKNLKVCK